MKPAIFFLPLCFTAQVTLAATTVMPPSSGAGQAQVAPEDSEQTKLLEGVEPSRDNSPLGKAIRACEEGKYGAGLPVLNKLSKEGNLEATFILARLHRLGLGVEQSNEAAQKLLEQAADKGHANSLFELATLIESEDPEMALILYRQAAEAGQPLANLKLGYCHEMEQLGAPKNPGLAFSLYTKAAEAGLPQAIFALARCFDGGIGTSPDALKSTRLCRQAALEGLVAAQLEMAVRYYEGNGVEKDAVAAVGWLTVASQNGSADAQILLGIRYEDGDAVIRDLNQAGRYFSMAATQGNLVGRHRLAMLYRDGKGTPKDPIRAYVLLSQAKGYAPAEKDLMQLVGAMKEDEFKEAQAKLAELEKAAEEEKAAGE